MALVVREALAFHESAPARKHAKAAMSAAVPGPFCGAFAGIQPRGQLAVKKKKLSAKKRREVAKKR